MRSRLRIVVDTNALVSRLLLPSSVHGQAVRKAVDDSILLVSEATMNELADVLARPNSTATSASKTASNFYDCWDGWLSLCPLPIQSASAVIPKTTNFSKLR